MNWVVLLIVVAGITAVAAWHASKEVDVASPVIAYIGTISSILILFVIVVRTICAPQSINNFERQKAYIETHAVINSVEDAALTAKKIELNEWLYGAQMSKSRFGGWSFYPDSIFDLEPID